MSSYWFAVWVEFSLDSLVVYLLARLYTGRWPSRSGDGRY